MLAKEKLEKAKELKECYNYFNGHDSNAKAVATNKAKEFLETEVEGCGDTFKQYLEEVHHPTNCGNMTPWDYPFLCDDCQNKRKEANKILNAICVLDETEAKN